MSGMRLSKPNEPITRRAPKKNSEKLLSTAAVAANSFPYKRHPAKHGRTNWATEILSYRSDLQADGLDAPWVPSAADFNRDFGITTVANG
jgi:hypothetical protein